MKDGKTRRSNEERTEATRAALIAAARGLFAEKGFADTGTPEIAAAAGVTRGALYHQFRDKADLLTAVLGAEGAAVTEAIEAASSQPNSPREGLLAGAIAYFDAMAAPGRARLLLVEGPAALPRETMKRLEDENGAASLREGLSTVLGTAAPESLNALTALFSAAFDRAALEIAEGAAREPYEEAIRSMLAALADPSEPDD